MAALRASRRQFNASVLSANREKWITTLREAIAELVSLLATASRHKANWEGTWNQGHAALAAQPELLPKFERAVRLKWNIRLLINPNEADHLALCDAIDSAVRRLQSGSPSEFVTESDVERIACASQVVLRAAWRRVKEGT